jgi:hypothetical protein
MKGRTMNEDLMKAEQQLTGFAHARQGYDVISLAQAMALRPEEWEALKENAPWLPGKLKAEIDAYMDAKRWADCPGMENNMPSTPYAGFANCSVCGKSFYAIPLNGRKVRGKWVCKDHLKKTARQSVQSTCSHAWRNVTNGEYFVVKQVCDSCGASR